MGMGIRSAMRMGMGWEWELSAWEWELRRGSAWGYNSHRNTVIN